LSTDAFAHQKSVYTGDEINGSHTKRTINRPKRL